MTPNRSVNFWIAAANCRSEQIDELITRGGYLEPGRGKKGS